MSAICGLVVLLLIELLVRKIAGIEDFSPLSPEYIALFPSQSIALEVDILLYGVIGATFSGMSFIYEKDRIGFVLQNIIYFVLTSVVWLPIVTLIWQLHRYPTALLGTLSGFTLTYLIMSVVGYRITKKEVAEINHILAQKKNENT